MCLKQYLDLCLITNKQTNKMQGKKKKKGKAKFTCLMYNKIRIEKKKGLCVVVFVLDQPVDWMVD